MKHTREFKDMVMALDYAIEWNNSVIEAHLDRDGKPLPDNEWHIKERLQENKRFKRIKEKLHGKEN